MNADSSIQDLLAAIAAKRPTPGGGAVAAVCGALAAAMGEMVLNYSVGRKATPQFDAELTHVLDELTRARAIMLELVVEDQQAFAELTEARKLSADDPTRLARVAGGVERCIDVPRTIATTGLAILRVVGPIVDKSNRWLLSDLGVCVELAMATIRSAHYSVRANLGDVDESRRTTLVAECEGQSRRGVALLLGILNDVARVSNP